MNIQKKKKRIQKIISIVLIASLSCVCVMGDYCQSNRNGRREWAQKTVPESLLASATGSRQGNQLRSMKELKTAETETEPARIQETLQEGYSHLSAAYESGAGFREAADAFAALVSRSEKQIKKELDQTDNGTVEHQEYRDYILESYRKLGKYAGKLNGSNPDKVMKKIRDMMEPETPYVALGEDLPFGAVAESDIPTEEYTEADAREYSPQNTRYSKQELESTNDTIINDKVRKEFQDLESPLEIYQYVKNNYLPEFYYGSRKGAIGTYEQKAGNDYDMASLLVGVFRDRSIPARYARGKIEITAEQAMDWTASYDIETAQRQIAALGIPVTGLVSEGKTVAIRMEHVWVEAYVPYTDYRGAGNQSGESLWIPLDPAFKSLSWLEGIDLSYLSDYINQESNIVQEDTELYGVNIGGFSTMTGKRESAFVKYMLENGYGEATLTEAFGGREIWEEDLAYLPLTLPYAVSNSVETFSDIPEELTDSISISLTSDYDFTGEDFTTGKLYTPDIYGKRLILTYVPAAEEDEAALEQYGGLFQTPAYLLRLKPQLLLDGEIVAEGAPCPSGIQQKYTISIHSAAPGRQDSGIGNSIVAGRMYCIASDYGTMSADNLQKSAGQMEALQETVSEASIYTEEAMGNLLDSIGKAYFARLDLYNAVISGQDNVCVTRDFSVGIVGFNINVVSSFGRPTELNEGGIFLDIGHNIHSVVSNENDEDAEKHICSSPASMLLPWSMKFWNSPPG